MRIGIDVRLLRVPRGIGNSIHGLLTGLSRIQGEHDFFLYADSYAAVGRIPRDPRFHVRVMAPHLYPYWEQVRLPMAVSHDNLQVLHCPGNTAPIIPLSGTRLIVTVHDVIYLAKRFDVGNSAQQRIQNTYYRMIVPLVARIADLVVTDSEYSREEIAGRLRVARSKLKVISLAPSEHFRELQDIDRSEIRAEVDAQNYIIAPAAEDPRKNTARVLEVFADFLPAHPEYRLVLVGLGKSALDRFSAMVHKLHIADRVNLHGFLPEEQLVRLYNGARFALYPSLYEGFGLPVLEAMACGVPVITSSTTSIPEVAGDAALLVNPEDPDALLEAMCLLGKDVALRAAYSLKGKERVRRFCLGRLARETLELYESVR